MKKIIFIMLAVAIASCSKEERVEPTAEVSKFTGDFKVVTTVVSAPQAGELISAITHECPDTFTFQADFVFKINVYGFDEVSRECAFKYQSSNYYETPEDNVILIGLEQTVYEVIRRGDDLILATTNTSTDIMREYFLKRI